MLIACSNCKSQYSLSAQEIQALPLSVFRCKNCEKNIKIAQCPQCMSHYSITFTTAGKPSYTIKCVKCSHTFTTEFPVVSNRAFGMETLPGAGMDSGRTAGAAFDKIDEAPPKRLFPKLGSSFPKEFSPTAHNSRRDEVDGAAETARKSDKGDSFNARDILAMGMSAFTMKKLVIASTGVFSIMLLLILYGTIIGLFYRSEDTYLSSLVNMFPMAIVLFGYTAIASVLSRLTLEETNDKSGRGVNREFISKVLTVSITVNAFLMILVNLVLILFGELPIIGPVFFSLLFLPIYVISLIIVLLYTIGLWFLPSIIAVNEGGILSVIENFIQFIKKYNFSLVYTILTLTIGTSLIFAVVYLFHYGALSITFTLSHSILSEEGMKVFSAVPTAFLRISDMSIVSANINLFHSLIRGLIASHHVGGVILGVVFSALTVLLIALFVSITSSVSSKVYTAMESGVDLDDRKKIRLLSIFALILLCLFLFKKVFL